MHILSISRSSTDVKGFTLIELLITLMIIAILATVSAAAYIGVAKKAARSEAYTNLQTLKLLQDQRFADNADYAPTRLTTTLIQDNEFPNFRPATGSNYMYSIVHDVQITDNTGSTVASPPTWGVLAPCFSAVATGIAGRRTAGDRFTIDCNNVRNF